MKPLEEAARSRSEADWLVGHERDARRLASACAPPSTAPSRSAACRRRRSRSSPAASWRSAPSCPSRTGSSRRASRRPASAATSGRYLGGKRIPRGRGDGDRRGRRPGRPATITKLEKKEEREQPQLLYDLTSLQRHANTLYGFSARRTLAAAQRLYEEHKAITYPRTNSRFLTGDMIGEIKPTAELVGPQRAVRAGRRRT